MRARRAVLWAIVIGAALTGCGEEPSPIAGICGVSLPPPSYGEPSRPPETDPGEPPYRRVTYHYTCVDGMLVEETWERDQDDCWYKRQEYRRENPFCSGG